MDNYIRLFNRDADFIRSLRATGIFTIVVVPGKLILSLGLFCGGLLSWLRRVRSLSADYRPQLICGVAGANGIDPNETLLALPTQGGIFLFLVLDLIPCLTQQVKQLGKCLWLLRQYLVDDLGDDLTMGGLAFSPSHLL